jgi:hypothetical protein
MAVGIPTTTGLIVFYKYEKRGIRTVTRPTL